jgi:hypothetical protein
MATDAIPWISLQKAKVRFVVVMVGKQRNKTQRWMDGSGLLVAFQSVSITDMGDVSRAMRTQDGCAVVSHNLSNEPAEDRSISIPILGPHPSYLTTSKQRLSVGRVLQSINSQITIFRTASSSLEVTIASSPGLDNSVMR